MYSQGCGSGSGSTPPGSANLPKSNPMIFLLYYVKENFKKFYKLWKKASKPHFIIICKIIFKSLINNIQYIIYIYYTNFYSFQLGRLRIQVVIRGYYPDPVFSGRPDPVFLEDRPGSGLLHPDPQIWLLGIQSVQLNLL